eukprot:CAMPEP_0179088780 /NCGR_PEP_ID=MMETSP0796-20121207/40415_1 /TAXON_ID=73915 /ORGANISM="Pyrodinium bahamense, Strain pbaha01" /LENGTH=198 /DNA_ID=CAMNT_0020786319 /DNA_START=1 /DNA_END=593 /DNA_ORIENTATION=-
MAVVPRPAMPQCMARCGAAAYGTEVRPLAWVPPDTPVVEAATGDSQRGMANALRQRAWRAALAIFAEARMTRDPEVGVACYSMGVRACEQGNHWKWVAALLADMQQEALRPDVSTFTGAMRALQKVLAVGRGAKPLQRVSSGWVRLGLDVGACSTAVSACERGEQWEMALGFLKQSQAAGLPLSLVTCSAAISACAKG